MQTGIFLLFLFILGLSVAWFFVKEWYRNEVVRKELEAIQLSTEIKFLKSQVNPHFLFNTLNNLFSMAQQKGNDELADSISKLSGMMRYMIYESNAEMVPLSREIEYLQNCIALNKLRFEDKEAMVNFNYQVSMQEVIIAPMIFIPFVENAFKHGVAVNKASHIGISIAANEQELEFTCENPINNHIKKMNDHGTGLGLENVKRRLELIYPGKHDLHIKNEGNKYQVILKINLK
ncbi:MAG: histidine kinase [Ferruginibacter sp.]